MEATLLAIHVLGGVLGLLSGAAALSFGKGSPRHRLAGNVFFAAMATMGASAALLGNVLGGLFACYLVATGWLTARQPEGKTSIGDWGAFGFALATGVALVAHGVRVTAGTAVLDDGVPVGMVFFLGVVALLAAAGDLRMLVRGGVFGVQRIARHLWRMCFSFFIATGSFFLGQQQVFPEALRGSIWFVPAVLPLAALVYWLVRVRLPPARGGQWHRPRAL